METFLVRVLTLPLILTTSEGLIQTEHFTKFTASRSWNDAKKICADNGGHLATVDSYSTSYLRHAFEADSFKYGLESFHNRGRFLTHDFRNNYMWIGLHDAAPEYNSLGAGGFIWDTCLSMGQWDNWKSGQPVQRYNNWCVRLDYTDRLKWFPEQCGSEADFLCQKTFGTCETFRNGSAGCDLTSPSLTDLSLNLSSSWQQCRSHCVAYSEGNQSCWMFVHSAVNGNCTITVGAEPIYCQDDAGATTATTGSETNWVRQCYFLTYNTTFALPMSPWEEFPLDNCSETTPSPPETTSTATTASPDREMTTERVSTSNIETTMQTSSVDAATSSPQTTKIAEEGELTTTSRTMTAVMTDTTTNMRDSTITMTKDDRSTMTKDEITTEAKYEKTNGVKDTTDPSEVTSAVTTDSEKVTTEKAMTMTEQVVEVTSQRTTHSENDLSSVSTDGKIDISTKSTAASTRLTAVTTTEVRAAASTKDDEVTNPSTAMTIHASDATTTVSMPATTGPGGLTNTTTSPPKAAGHYVCKCVCGPAVNQTLTNIQEVTQKIVEELTVDKSQLSSTRRKLTSAPDPRPSAQATGALGIVLLCVCFGLIFLMDAPVIFNHIGRDWGIVKVVRYLKRKLVRES